MGVNPFYRAPGSIRGATRRASRATRPHQARRILIVDDESAVREILATLLSMEGEFAGTAANGPEALEKLEKQGPWDVVITDRAMPAMPGDELAAEIKKRWPRVRVIMLTGFTGPMDPVGEQAQAIDLFMAKPFTLAGVMEGIEQVCAEESPVKTAGRK
jgi:CheY-like chemotaxis protein